MGSAGQLGCAIYKKLYKDLFLTHGLTGTPSLMRLYMCACFAFLSIKPAFEMKESSCSELMLQGEGRLRVSRDPLQ